MFKKTKTVNNQDVMIEMKDTAKGVRFIVKVVTRGLFCQKAVVKNFTN